MSSANVLFSRADGTIVMELSIDGRFIIRTSSQESIVRELQMNEAQGLAIEDKFFTELPTTLKTLSIATEIPFGEYMAALKLVAACASIEGASLVSKPERRAIPRSEKPQPSMVD